MWNETRRRSPLPTTRAVSPHPLPRLVRGPAAPGLRVLTVAIDVVTQASAPPLPCPAPLPLCRSSSTSRALSEGLRAYGHWAAPVTLKAFSFAGWAVSTSAAAAARNVGAMLPDSRSLLSSLERAFEPVSTVPLGRKAGSLRGLWFALLFCSATEPNTASHGACCSNPVSTAGMATAESPYAAVLAALERELRPAPSPGFRSRALSLQALTAACVLSSLSRPSCACRLNLAPARRYIVLSLVYLAFLRYCAERSPHLSTPLLRRVRRRLLSELRRS